jgi:O-antigen ligase
MSANTFTVRRPGTAVPTPSWTVLSMLGMAGAVYAAVTAGGDWPLTLALLLVVSWAFLMVLRHPHLGIMVFLSTFLINYPGALRGAGPITINNLLGVVFLSLLMWDYYQHGDLWYLGHPLVRILLVIGGIFIAGTVAAEFLLPDHYVQNLITKPLGATYFKTDYTSRFLFQFFSRFTFTLFIVKLVETPRQLLWVFLALLGCILAAVPPSLYGYLTTHGEDVRALTKVVNWADNANRFAFGCLIGVGFCYWLATNARTRLGKLAAAGCAALLLPLVLLSASRSGFIGMFLLAGLVLSGAFGGTRAGLSRRGTVAGVFLFAGIAVITYFFVLSPSMQERLLNLNPFDQAQEEGSKSTEFREATLRDSVDIIAKFPITGVGLGNFRWVHKHFYGRFKPPHNSYIWALSEGGVPLLIVFAVLFAMLWQRIGRLRDAYVTHPELPCFPHFLRVYLFLFLFFSMFADVWIEEHVFLMVGATILLERWLQADAAVATPPVAGRPGPVADPAGRSGPPAGNLGWAAATATSVPRSRLTARTAQP